MARIVVGMSGGVDSSLSAVLLQEQGHEVVGVTMKLWPCADDGGFTREDACCSPTETIDARAVAQSSGVAHYVLDLESEFRRQVVGDFLTGYASGQTPNPCVRCNESIKFGELWDYAQQLGAERVATGHYARVSRPFDERWLLRTSVDVSKDQTYFLFSLTQEQLAHADFPVGGMTKQEVRQASRDRGLVTADKHESQDICFIGDQGLLGFLKKEIPQAFVPGAIELADGTHLGEHAGLTGYTVGQRKGLGVAWREPLFVLRLDTARNVLVLGPRPALLVERMELRDCTWHLGELPVAGLECLVRTRHRGQPVPALIRRRDGAAGTSGSATVQFREPQIRTSPGQACVAYDATLEWCLGGGWVEAPAA